MRTLAVGLLSLVVGCGGTLGDDAGAGDAAADGGVDGLGPGWTQCTSPEGYRVCSGPNDCPSDDATCGGCVTSQNPQPNDLGHCGSGAPPYSDTVCGIVDDGLICAEDTFAGGFWGAQFDYGVLLAMNGAADRVRYADMGLWTGEPLPTPATCPTLAHATLCGGNCGGCGASEICHGRSPLHPWGICISKLMNDTCWAEGGKLCSDPNNKCFTYTIQPSAQKDAYSLCMPATMCDDLAANLPGGATCQ